MSMKPTLSVHLVKTVEAFATFLVWTRVIACLLSCKPTPINLTLWTLGISPSHIDILMGTFTKSFGAAGGYIAADKVSLTYELECMYVCPHQPLTQPLLEYYWPSSTEKPLVCLRWIYHPSCCTANLDQSQYYPGRRWYKRGTKAN